MWPFKDSREAEGRNRKHEPRRRGNPYRTYEPTPGNEPLMNIPRTIGEARQHIEAIRDEKGVQNLDRNVKDLEAALEL